MFLAQFFIIGASILLLIITVMLIKKRVLREEYSIIWIAAEIALLMLGIYPALPTPQFDLVPFLNQFLNQLFVILIFVLRLH